MNCLSGLFGWSIVDTDDEPHKDCRKADSVMMPLSMRLQAMRMQAIDPT